ncbi:jg27839 [Pararge aegeria aegeria]|uniref:Jg27839 protein n=1 Tax=Pararge aegeria aegeria TaxID=348720 RepID=A0A8S4RDZ7_9NEOP|nr:jg27839 [Pararge aegeria aegeria]
MCSNQKWGPETAEEVELPMSLNESRSYNGNGWGNIGYTVPNYVDIRYQVNGSEATLDIFLLNSILILICNVDFIIEYVLRSYVLHKAQDSSSTSYATGAVSGIDLEAGPQRDGLTSSKSQTCDVSVHSPEWPPTEADRDSLLTRSLDLTRTTIFSDEGTTRERDRAWISSFRM